MDNYWTFKVFMDERGIDVIDKWRNDLPPGDKERIRHTFSLHEDDKNLGTASC